jgi:hypothetical protein
MFGSERMSKAFMLNCRRKLNNEVGFFKHAQRIKILKLQTGR